MAMIGKMIDGAALTALGAAGFYLFFLNAGLGIVGSCALAFISVILSRRVIQGMPVRRRVTQTQARVALMAIALMGEEDASKALIALTGNRTSSP